MPAGWAQESLRWSLSSWVSGQLVVQAQGCAQKAEDGGGASGPVLTLVLSGPQELPVCQVLSWDQVGTGGSPMGRNCPFSSTLGEVIKGREGWSVALWSNLSN